MNISHHIPTANRNGNTVVRSGSRARRLARPLRIAQIAPLYERIPPEFYGGTERVVSYLTEELVRRGHDVTLFASGDSKTSARLVRGFPRSLRLAGLAPMGTQLHLPMLTELYENADRFDVIHSHIDYWSFPFARLSETPTISTMHGRLDIESLKPIYDCFRDMALVSISNAQRAPIPHMNWVSTIHHGIPDDFLEFNPQPGKYLAFLGRISPEKGIGLAIDTARRAGIPFKIAAKVDAVDREYFETLIKPRLSPPDVEYIGEISEHEKSEFLGNALALLFTIDWPEPFGLAMIEAMACGTPVIARPCGSVPEVVRDGETGFVASSVEELAAAAGRVEDISRARCRAEFESRFRIDRMAEQYEAVYLRAAGGVMSASASALRAGSRRVAP